MNKYLIEFRFQGKAKEKIKGLIYNVNHKFKILHKTNISHITLAGPFTTRNEKKLIGVFNNTCHNTKLMNFVAKDFGTFFMNRVVYIDIKPSKNLDYFRWHLVQRLKSFCRLKNLDYKRKFFFHATVVKHLNLIKFIRVWLYLRNNKKIEFPHFVARMTLLKNGKILREYDFLLRRPLNRTQSLNKRTYSRTIKLIKRKIG